MSFPSLLEAMRGWKEMEVQFIVATHSPLVLTSIEPRFEPQRDALWKLD